MPDYSDIPRAAGDAAEPPAYAELAARAVRRRRTRRAATAGAAALAVAAIFGANQFVMGGDEAAPDPAPEPQPEGLVFTRPDGSTVAPIDLVVSCSADGRVVRVTGVFPAEGTDEVDPERSEPTLAGSFRLVVPLGSYAQPLTFSGEGSLRFVDPRSSDTWLSGQLASVGRFDEAVLACAPRPSIDFIVDATLDRDGTDDVVRVAGHLDLTALVEPRQEPATPVAIVDAPTSRLAALVVSPTDPDSRAAVWQKCRAGGQCVAKYAVAVTTDGFATRSIVHRVFVSQPTLTPAGPWFHVLDGLGPGQLISGDGEFAGPDSEPVQFENGPVVAIGSGLHLWTVIGGGMLPDAESMNQIVRLSDGSLAGLEYVHDSGSWVFALTRDEGLHWSRTPLDVGPNAFLRIIDGGDGRAVVIEGADGATLFPFVAAHRQDTPGGAFTRFAVDGGPRAYVAGETVLPDGRLLVAVEAWGDESTPPGLYVSAGADWSTFEEVETGAPYDAAGGFEARFVATSRSGDTVRVFLEAPPGDDAAAYSSDDGGRTWRAVPAR